jgi:hypothetical protein
MKLLLLTKFYALIPLADPPRGFASAGAIEHHAVLNLHRGNGTARRIVVAGGPSAE